MKLLIIGGVPRSLMHFRGPLIKTMLARGHAVSASANGHDPETEKRLAKLGVDYHPIPLARAGLNPLADMVTLYHLCRVIRRVRPDVVLAYTIKPVIWGGCAARLASNARVFSMIEGLGYAFMPAEGFKHWIAAVAARVFYRVSLSGSSGVFFLNPDDLSLFLENRYTKKHKAHLLDGIGVDNEYYGFEEARSARGSSRFLMIARLMKDKGVREYVDAARAVNSRYPPGDGAPSPQFRMAGGLDSNPASISKAELDTWRAEGIIDYLGKLSDVRPAYRDSDVFVLPSYYREGVPRTILEAMAMGRPIITTDSPGCRETVLMNKEDGTGGHLGEGSLPQGFSTHLAMHEWARRRGLRVGANGILVPPRDADALAAAMAFFIDNPEQIAVMGRASRRYAEDRYDVHKVNAMILDAMGL